MPNRLVWLALEAVVNAAFPVAGQILTELRNASLSRFQNRLLLVAGELEAQLRSIEGRIPDKLYYESEEFQTLFFLLLERLQTTHQQEKLKMFGKALANSGRGDFQSDDEDLYVRLIRDLSEADVLSLTDSRLQSNSPALPPGYSAAEIARFSRLASLGILVEQRYTGFGGGPGTAGADRHYFVAELGKDLLRFISVGDSAVTA